MTGAVPLNQVDGANGEQDQHRRMARDVGGDGRRRERASRPCCRKTSRPVHSIPEVQPAVADQRDRGR